MFAGTPSLPAPSHLPVIAGEVGGVGGGIGYNDVSGSTLVIAPYLLPRILPTAVMGNVLPL